ncbi:uncharacterized protein F58A4.6 [Scaptodrosophila lebanonensis]|uniref:Uncharacterized protein F58A4.6 n=1 Tax=Drosophila lebanonensis TaxID=7225 RepID=A0A6J2TV53_DROLE|nr:uncharacterized protein F58A4.6 [Scaptodrosophila lebanonensis]XP_030379466.1 uncharacterized protein F58A4.6 [Scaptodrosophila lebanonensis]
MTQTLTVCICDYWQRRHYYHPSSCNNDPMFRVAAGGSFNHNNQNLRRLQLKLDAISGNYWLREILQQQALRRRLQERHGVQLLWLELQPPVRDTIDYKWADMLAHTLWEHIEVEHLMSWLSTLGGGFSALGEQFERCADTAGKISLQQLHIGMRLGDPFLQARCKLYYSISLIQRGQLRLAKHLIRSQYQFAKVHKEHDIRLVRMCQGIWLRLCFEYKERQKQKMLARESCAIGDGERKACDGKLAPPLIV